MVELNVRDDVHVCKRDSRWRGRAEASLLAVRPEQKADGAGCVCQAGGRGQPWCRTGKARGFPKTQLPKLRGSHLE